MNKAQASKIRTRLLAVGKALNKVDEAISELNKEDREVFADPMVHLDRVLRREALRIIYSRYPELQPGFDEISSDRRWEDVTLPPSISEADPSHRAVNVFDLAPRGRGFRDLALVLRADHFVPPRLTPAGENVDVIGGAHDSAFKLRPH
jgi:hypothetical protein